MVQYWHVAKSKIVTDSQLIKIDKKENWLWIANSKNNQYSKIKNKFKKITQKTT